MTNWEHRHLGATRAPGSLSELEIDHFFTLRPAEKALVLSRQGAANRVGLALMIGMLRMTGRRQSRAPSAPKSVLQHIGRQISVAAPEIASLRTLYRREATRAAHEAAARAVMGFKELSSGARSQLVGYLRAESATTHDAAELERRARVWLYTHATVAPPARALEVLCRDALRRHEAALAAAIRGAVGDARVNGWIDALSERVSDGVTRHEWLRGGPRKKSVSALRDQSEKVRQALELGAATSALDGLPKALIAAYARRVELRRPAQQRRIREPRRTVETACFLRRQLTRNTDLLADLFGLCVTDCWRQAHEAAAAAEARKTPDYRRATLSIHAAVSDPTLSDAESRARVAALVAPLMPDARGPTSRVGAARLSLAGDAGELRSVLEVMSVATPMMAGDHPLRSALACVETTPRRGDGALLADGVENVFGAAWAPLIDHSDRKLALGAWVAATALLYKRSLANGSASLPHGDRYRAPEDHLIPAPLWRKDRGRFIRDLGAQESATKYLQRIEAGLDAGLQALAEAVADDATGIDGDRLVIPRPKAAPEDPAVDATRKAIMAQIGEAQLPDVIVDVDGWTAFSNTLLGRPPRTLTERVTAYAALLALGSDLEAADVGRMVRGVSADSVELMMRAFEGEDRLRRANDAVVDFMRGLAIARRWGSGVGASSDMMSLDATQGLWNARIDPRRRRYAVGLYTHMLDQWGVIYDQPIVLNRRQAGAAIEGALRQEHAELERLAVDTHGVTHVSMALAKLLGFDLCPRLAGMSERKLHVFRDTPVPPILEPIVSRTLSRRTISVGWDGLLRLAASIQGGWCSAVWALDRFGSAARGDPVFNAADALGKALRTAFLCDYASQVALRAEIQSLLSRGEALHRLQRAVHPGSLRPRRGRSPEQATAISGALTLIVNIVMAWNAARMDAIVRAAPGRYDEDHLRHIAPISHRHINMRGIFTFDLDRTQGSESEARDTAA